MLQLCVPLRKAEYQGKTVTNVPTVPMKKKERLSPSMRVKPGKISTGKGAGGHRMSTEEMHSVGSVWNKEPYECKECKVKVHPPGLEKVGATDVDRLHSALASGGSYAGTKSGDEGLHHVVKHPPKLEITSESKSSKGKVGKVFNLEHGSVEAEHVERKTCPSCYQKQSGRTTLATARGATPEASRSAAEAKIKKSLELITEMIKSTNKAYPLGEGPKKTQGGGQLWLQAPAPKEQKEQKFPVNLASAPKEEKSFKGPEGEEFGKPVSQKTGQGCVSEEIRHLKKDKGYPQERAVAAALNICGESKKVKKSLPFIYI